MASSIPYDHAAASKKGTEPKLKLDEMIPVFQLLPTSELIRFVSSRGSLFGEYWSAGFKYVFESRLPLSLKWSRPRASDAPRFELLDNRGTKVADVKHPELFRFSLLCGLTEDATLARRYHHDPATSGYYLHYDVLCIKDGSSLIGSLASVTSLTLELDNYVENKNSDLHLNRDVLSNGGNQLSQIESLTLKPGWLPVESPYYMRFDILPSLIQQMSGLRALRITCDELCALVPSLRPELGYGNAAAVDILSGLESLSILRCGTNETSAGPILDFLSERCTQLCELVMLVRGELRQYLDCWRALPSLTCLGLDILGTYQNVLVFSESDAPVTSVRDLRVFCQDGTFDQLLLYVLSKFPSLTSLSLACRSPFQLLRYASAVCSDEDVLRSLRTLKCFSYSEGGMPTNSSWADYIVAFLQNPNLPYSVDLSQMLTFSTYIAASDFDFLVKVYGVMQKNPVGLLVLKGRVQSEAITRLQDFLSMKGSPGQVTRGRIIAWQQECHGPCDDPLGQRNVKITGAKTSGRWVGEKFVVRIYYANECSIGVFDM